MDFEMDFSDRPPLTYRIENGYIFEINDGLKSSKYKLNSRLEKELSVIKSEWRDRVGDDMRQIHSTKFLLDEYENIREPINLRDSELEKIIDGILQSKKYACSSLHLNTIEKIIDYADARSIDLTEKEAKALIN